MNERKPIVNFGRHEEKCIEILWQEGHAQRSEYPRVYRNCPRSNTLLKRASFSETYTTPASAKPGAIHSNSRQFRRRT